MNVSNIYAAIVTSITTKKYQGNKNPMITITKKSSRNKGAREKSAILKIEANEEAPRDTIRIIFPVSQSR